MRRIKHRAKRRAKNLRKVTRAATRWLWRNGASGIHVTSVKSKNGRFWSIGVA